MAGSNAIASGAAILTTNADGFASGLKKAEGDMKGFGKRVQAEADKGAGGVGNAFKANVLGFSAAEYLKRGIEGLADRLFKSASGFYEAERGAAAMDRQFKELAESIERTNAAKDKWLDVGAGPADTIKNIDREKARVDQQLTADLLAAGKFDRKLNQFSDPFGSAGAFGAYLSQTHGEYIEDMTKNYDAAMDRISNAKKRLADLDERRGKLANPNLDDEKVKGTNAQTKALELQAKQYGATARMSAFLDAKAKGFSPEQIRQYLSAFDKVAATDRLKALDDFSDGLARQVATFGESAAAAQLYDLKLKDLSDEQMKWAEKVLKAQEQIEKGAAAMKPQLAGAVMAGSTEAYSLVMRNQLRGVDENSAGAKALLEAAKASLKAELDTAKNTRKTAERLASLGEF